MYVKLYIYILTCIHIHIIYKTYTQTHMHVLKGPQSKNTSMSTRSIQIMASKYHSLI